MTDFQTAIWLSSMNSQGEDTLFERFIFDLFQMQGIYDFLLQAR